ncbi:MAG: hypothetical protein CMF26_05875 [Kiloniella sp.]|nr:hypothetical protein [Kiloniella sp.]
MIKFSLHCSQGHSFEAWFPDSAGFEDQRQRGLVTCPHCNDTVVEKTLMKPSVRGGRNRGQSVPPPQQAQPTASAGTAGPRVKQALQTSSAPNNWSPEQVAAARQFFHSMRATVEKTHEDVGDKFADEARAIHEGEKPDRGIRGKASKEQVDALLDDGIEVLPLPDIKLDG